MIRFIASIALALLLGPCTLCSPAQCQTVPHPQIQKDGNVMKPYAVVFSATWCEPCQRYKPKIEALRKQGYLVYIIDVDKAPRSKELMQVSNLPTTIVMNHGQEQDRHTGMMEVAQLKDFIDSNIDNVKPDDSSPDDDDPGIPLPNKPKDYKVI